MSRTELLLDLRQKSLEAKREAERYLSMADLQNYYYYEGIEDGLERAIKIIEEG